MEENIDNMYNRCTTLEDTKNISQLCENCPHEKCPRKETIQSINDVKRDSILSDMDISNIVDEIFRVGKRKKEKWVKYDIEGDCNEVIYFAPFKDVYKMIYEANIKKENVYKMKDADKGYVDEVNRNADRMNSINIITEIDIYDCDDSGNNITKKEDILGITKEDLKQLIFGWKNLNMEIQYFENKRGGILDTDKLKYRKNREHRNSLWERIESVFSFFSNPTTMTQKTTEQPKLDVINTNNSKLQSKLFIDYLFYDNIPSLMATLKDLLVGKKGREVAKVIMALEDKHYLVVPTKGLEGLRKSMIVEFGNIGTKQSISKFYRKPGTKNDLNIPQREIQQIIDILP